MYPLVEERWMVEIKENIQPTGGSEVPERKITQERRQESEGVMGGIGVIGWIVCS